MNTLKFGNGEWYGKKDTILAYNDENSNFKPLPFSFDRASSATRVNNAGLIETVGSGEPRIDFSNDAKGALLLEPQRSNLITYSEDFSHSSWVKNGTLIIPNTTIAPDGGLTAYTLTFSGSNQYLLKTANYTSTVGSKATISLFTKTEIQILSFGGATPNGTDVYGFESYANGWYRQELTRTFSVAATGTIQYILYGLAIGDYIIWGAQVEESYATSYIPTQGSAVTRVAETCINENLNVDYSGDYTLYLEHETLSITEYNQFQFRQETSISYIFRVGNSINIGTNLYTAANTIGFNKFALSVTSIGSYKFYKNGVLLSSGSGLNANLETLKNDALGMNIKEIKLYNNALTDQELQALTTI